MSLTWTKQIWASEELSHPTDRLMLLALAHHADDEGLCWPSVETLQRRSSLKTRRGARKVLERLESGHFIERLERPGRSNVYRLRAERLAPAKAQDREPQPRTLERLDQGTPERQDQARMEHQGRRTGTPGSDGAKRPDQGKQNTGTGRTLLEPSRNHNGSAPVGANDRERLLDLLTARGVHLPEARRLARRYEAKRITLQVKHFDYLCSIGQPPRSGGWLPAAIRRRYPLPPPLLQRLDRQSPPPRAAAPTPPPERPSDSRRCAQPETVQAALASAMAQLEKNGPGRDSPQEERKPRRPWWAQEPIPPHVLEEIEHQRLGYDAQTQGETGPPGFAPANPNSASAEV